MPTISEDTHEYLIKQSRDKKNKDAQDRAKRDRHALERYKIENENKYLYRRPPEVRKRRSPSDEHKDESNDNSKLNLRDWVKSPNYQSNKFQKSEPAPVWKDESHPGDSHSKASDDKPYSYKKRDHKYDSKYE